MHFIIEYTLTFLFHNRNSNINLHLPAFSRAHSLPLIHSRRRTEGGIFFPFKDPGGARFPAKMGAALLSELVTEIVIPVCAVVGIAFSLVQWLLVSRVKLTPERHGPSSSPRNNKNGYGDYLIEEEEGINDHNVVIKCAEIQSAISEGEVWVRSDDLAEI